MAIVLVRHGESILNKAKVFQFPDTPLSDRGHLQAQKVGQRVADMNITRIIASDYERAHSTAKAVSEHSGIPVEIEILLRERNFGDLRGLKHDDIDFDSHAADYEPPDGESWPVFHARVTDAWGAMLKAAEATTGNLAVVSHGLVCASLAENQLNLIKGETMPAHWPNTAVTVFDSAPPHSVTVAGCGAHLDTPESADAGYMAGL